MRKIILSLVCAAAAALLIIGIESCSTGTYEAQEREVLSSNPPPPQGMEIWILGKAPEPAPGIVPPRQGLPTGPDGWRSRDDLPKGGELRAKVSGERTVPLPLKHTDVKARVSIYIASVSVRQQYQNPFSEKIEAVYVFPLPEDAAVRDFVMTIGDRHIRGIIREREEARRIYQEARSQGYVASLLTEERPNIFTQSVANIEPGKEIDIEIAYFHALKYRDGEYEFVFPMVVGPRYNPQGSTDGVGAVSMGPPGRSGQRTEVQYLRPEEVSAHDISLEVDLDAGLPIETIACPSHKVDMEKKGENRALVRLSPEDRIPNKDFVLRYRPRKGGIQAALATFKDETGGYFTLVVEPPVDLAEFPAPPREMVFVLDTSGSMTGAPIEKAKAVVLSSLKRLRPCDTFQVIRFSQDASQFGPAPVPATPENIRSALEYVGGLGPGGGTEMIQGIRSALDFPHEEGRFRIVLFLTDGYIGNEREILAEERKRLGSSRVFSLGVGTSVNRYLLEEMARAGRGAVAYVGLDERDLSEVDRFFERIEHPALADIRLDWGGLDAREVFPDPIPDLFPGRPVVLAGRFGAAGGKFAVKIAGNMGGRPIEIPLAVDLDRPGTEDKALASVWARAKIASLSFRLSSAPDVAECQGQILQVALQHGLVSDYTAFVAVDSLTRTQGDHGTTVPVPVPVPQGVRYDTTVSE